MVLKGGTISMPTGRHVDNVFIPGLKTKTDFNGFSRSFFYRNRNVFVFAD